MREYKLIRYSEYLPFGVFYVWSEKARSRNMAANRMEERILSPCDCRLHSGEENRTSDRLSKRCGFCDYPRNNL